MMQSHARPGSIVANLVVPRLAIARLAVARLAVTSLAVVMLAIGAVHAPALAQSADLVLCDRLAADPADPDKPADVAGVAQIAAGDVATAIKFCKIAAAKSRRALYELGRAYAANRQMPEAVRAYRDAAAKGSSSAMVELGVLIGTGAGGQTKNPAEARGWFERAAKVGNARGVMNLAALNGGTPADPNEARALLGKAAAANSAEAEFQLGLMNVEGTGGAKDDAAARVLFEKAAAQGHVEAMVWAGAFAEIGRGGPKDEAVAKSWYAKAAAAGNEQARTGLKRIECPYVLKDKSGKVMSNLCF